MIPRVAEFWPAAKARLGSSTMNTILGGAGRVYAKDDNYAAPLGSRNTPWGRVVIGQTATLWPSIEQQGVTERLSFFVRAEFNDFNGIGYDVNISLEAALAEAHNKLQGWLPTGFQHLLVALPIYRQTAITDEAVWDDTRGMWVLSVEYRTEVSPVYDTFPLASMVVYPAIVVLTNPAPFVPYQVQLVMRDTHGSLIDQTTRDITWMSSNPAAALITSTGQLILQGSGETLLTIVCEGITAYALVHVDSNVLFELIPNATDKAFSLDFSEAFG